MMEEQYYMKSPCKKCPYRRDVVPYLTAERGEELAYHTQNPYSSFSCHATVEWDEDDNGNEYVESETKECAGYMAMQINECGIDPPEGFTPRWDLVYGDMYDMVDAYENPEEAAKMIKREKKTANQL